MDRIVHINNGSEKIEPLVLHLIPGEEIKLDLKIVNHGPPSNISLKASDEIASAVRTDKPDHYLAGEEIIPILARMPDVDRLEGEILLKGEENQSKLPIIFMRDSEDSDDEGSEGDEEPSDDEEKDSEKADPEMDSSTIPEESEEPEDRSRIKFSKDQDVQRYRASRVRRDSTVYRDISHRSHRATEDKAADHTDMEYQAPEFVDPGGERQAENPSNHEPNYGPPDSAEGSVAAEVPEEEGSNELKSRLFEFTGDKSTLLAVPAAMLVALIALLILTFYTETLPEFTGALASAMLIVTLIIYGASTLLKA